MIESTGRVRSNSITTKHNKLEITSSKLATQRFSLLTCGFNTHTVRTYTYRYTHTYIHTYIDTHTNKVMS